MNFIESGFVDNGYFIRDSDTQGVFRFDGLGKKIYLTGASFTTTALYSKWVNWAAQDDNVKWSQAMRTVGNDPIPGGLTGLFLFLMNGWQVVADSTVTFDGIIYHDDDGVSPFVILPGGGVTNKVAALAYGVSTNGTTGPSASDTAAAVWASTSRTLTSLGITPEQIAAAILAAAQITPIHSDMRKAVGQLYHGDGSEANKLRSTLVP